MHLGESALSIPRPDLDWSNLDNWGEGKLSLQHVQAVCCGAYPPFCGYLAVIVGIEGSSKL